MAATQKLTPQDVLEQLRAIRSDVEEIKSLSFDAQDLLVQFFDRSFDDPTEQLGGVNPNDGPICIKEDSIFTPRLFTQSSQPLTVNVPERPGGVDRAFPVRDARRTARDQLLILHDRLQCQGDAEGRNSDAPAHRIRPS
jgi:hypothetical protein